MALCRGASSSAAVSTSDAAKVDVEQGRVVKAHFWFCYFALYFEIDFALSREVDFHKMKISFTRVSTWLPHSRSDSVLAANSQNDYGIGLRLNS